VSSPYSEFQNVKARTGAYNGDLGSGAVASAMDEFAGNWNDHRQSLLNSIQTLATALRMFTGCPDLGRLQRAIPDIEKMAQKVSIIPFEWGNQ
jgi:hypothetical protein